MITTGSQVTADAATPNASTTGTVLAEGSDGRAILTCHTSSQPRMLSVS